MIAIIIYGPPGSGKGTQAKLLADKFGLIHFDTGDYLRKIIYSRKFQNNKEIQYERKLNEAGKLNTPSWVLKILSQRIRDLAKLKQSVILSGSPRTLFETFGDKKQTGLINMLEKLYRKENIFIFALDISPKESVKRNAVRLLCSTCQTPLLGIKKIQTKNCPFCGGILIRRRDDNKNIFLTRIKEYRERTLPIINKLKKRGYKIIRIDGKPLPFKIFQSILKHLPNAIVK